MIGRLGEFEIIEEIGCGGMGIVLKGYDHELGSFVRSYGAKDTDASLLQLPIVGFLPASDPRIVGTIELIERTLIHRGLVRRYDTARSEDGLPAGEQKDRVGDEIGAQHRRGR